MKEVGSESLDDLDEHWIENRCDSIPLSGDPDARMVSVGKWAMELANIRKLGSHVIIVMCDEHHY